ncbi:hypothetical protein C1H46_043300 [Malus baccata]|uniref:Uncharacterized protein n=1 Tax=Malus baccata TaxID=106549 RepID=A0A540KAB6_MALBA|nr:hypothetical protein C1H46_043300 [Malus baccata]
MLGISLPFHLNQRYLAIAAIPYSLGNTKVMKTKIMIKLYIKKMACTEVTHAGIAK